MSPLLAFLIEHGALLATGATALLGLGTLLVLFARQPVDTIALAEGTLLVVFAWIALAAVPMPRLPGLWSPSPAARTGGGAETTVPVPSRPPASGTGSPISRLDAAAAIPSPADRAAATGGPVRAGAGRQALPGRSEPAVPAAGMLAWLFLLGAAACALNLLLGALRLCSLLRGARPAPASLAAMLVAASDRGDRGDRGRHVRILVSRVACSPFCFGVRRPVIVLPRAMVESANEAEMHAVLMHELAHARRGDGWGRCCFALATPLLYWHPLFHFLRRRAQLASELLADDWASRSRGRGAYAAALIDLLERAPRGGCPIPGAAGVLRNRSEFYRRITMMMERRTALAHELSPRRRSLHAAVGAGLVLLVASVYGVEPLPAQAEPLPEPPRAPVPQDSGELHRLRAEVADLRAHLAALQAREAQQGLDRAKQGLDRILPHLQDPKGAQGLLGQLITSANLRAAEAKRLAVEVARAAPIADDAARQSAPALPFAGDLSAPVVDGATMQLIERILDLGAERLLLQRQLHRTARLAEAGGADETALATLEVRLDGATRKLQLARMMLAAESESSERSIAMLNQALKGSSGQERVALEVHLQRLHSRVKVLRAVE